MKAGFLSWLMFTFFSAWNIIKEDLIYNSTMFQWIKIYQVLNSRKYQQGKIERDFQLTFICCNKFPN